MKRLLIPAIAVILFCCHDKDPGPDLTSGAISFNWNTPGLITKYYVIISDTFGNVLQWSKLENNVTLEMPYPPGDSRLANVTLIGVDDRGTNIRSTTIDTFTGVPAGNYSFEYPMFQQLNTDAEVVARIEDIGTSSVYMYMSGKCRVKNITDGATFLEQVFGIIEGKRDDLYLTAFRSFSPVTTQQYLYYPDVQPGTIVVTSADFEDAPFLPEYPVTYPEQSSLEYTAGFIRGTTNGSYSLFYGQWGPDEQPSFNYPDMPGLFDEYETTMIGQAFNGDIFLTQTLGPNATTAFSNLSINVEKVTEVSTKRIAIDLDGTTDGAKFRGIFNDKTGSSQLIWHVFSSASNKAIRVNLPSFPDDLLTALPDLNYTKDGTFIDAYISNYQRSHEEVCQYYLQGHLYNGLAFTQSRYFQLNAGDGGRQSGTARVENLLKQLGLELPHK